MDEVGLGKSIQVARQKAGLTQQQLCQRADLSYSTLAKIERGAIKSPSIFTIQRISQALGIDVNEILGISSPNSSYQQPKFISKSGIRFVYFDVNGCLVHFYYRAFTKLAYDTGIELDKVEAAFFHFDDQACRGEITSDELNEGFSKKLGIKTIDWAKYYMEAVEPTNHMHELVTWAAKYYKVGLLSNMMPGIVNRLKQNKLIPDINYDASIISSDIGIIKPERKIFDLAQEKSGVKPSEILFLDDTKSNLMAAEQLGWRVIWVDDNDTEDILVSVKSILEPEV